MIKTIREIEGEIPSENEIYPVRHHLVHTTSAYYFSEYNSATVITLNGNGEYWGYYYLESQR